MSVGAPSEAQVRHYVGQIRQKAPLARVIGIRTPVEWNGPNSVTIASDQLPIIVGRSPLQIREALLEAAQNGPPAVLLTALDEATLGGDVVGRLAKQRLYTIDAWRLVLDLFRASTLDPRLRAQRWMADELLEALPVAGPDPVPTGVLDYRTAFSALLWHGFAFRSTDLDLRAVLEWIAAPGSANAYRKAPEAVQRGIAEFLGETAGNAAPLLLGCVAAGHGDRVVPIGIACRAIFATPEQPEAREAAIRLEPYVGTKSIDATVALAWATESEGFVRRQLDMGDKSAAARLLAAADVFLCDELGAPALARDSRFVPSGFKQRLTQVGSALEAALQNPSPTAAGHLTHAVQAAVDHVDADARGMLVRGLEMLPRLVAWFDSSRSVAPPKSFAEAAQRYLTDGGFVDWARGAIRDGAGAATLATAMNRLDAAVFAKREDENRIFATHLAAWSENPTSSGVLPIERVLEEIVAPIAANRPVLLLVLDGMGLPAFQELLEDIEQHVWIEVAPEGSPSSTVATVSTLPSITKFSRASLLAGVLCEGDQKTEKASFESHPKLRSHTAATHPPRLLHKDELRAGGAGTLSLETRTLIQDPAHRVLGVVVNAVDDHLAKGEQINTRWDCETIAPLHQILDAAAEAGRVVILTSDHGHVIECGTTGVRGSGGERWRTPEGSLDEGEILIGGPRVLPPTGGKVVLPWTERLRYGLKKNGYHGGATPQEVVVPLAVLTKPSIEVPGWVDRPPRAPAWWYLEPPPVVATPAAKLTAPAKRARGTAPSAKSDLPLFSGKLEPIAPPPSSATLPPWIEGLLRSELFQEQRTRAGRQPMSEERIRQFLCALEDHGGTLTTVAMARRLDVQPVRLPGILATFRKLLNIDGYAVVSVDEASASVTLNRELLFVQFGLKTS